MTSTTWIFSLEPIESRYTIEWFEHIPQLLSNNGLTTKQINGIQNNTAVTPGAFLNFSDTNFWKSSQLCNFLTEFNNGNVGPNDQILITDAWNPIVLQLRYMNDLLGYNWTIYGLWHAGSYDEGDFLGRAVGGQAWANHTELAMFNAYDYNCFATEFHIRLFKDTYPDIDYSKILRTGWPMEYMRDRLVPYQNIEKTNTIIFPHRISQEKQVEIFRDLAAHLPQYEFIVCQDNQLSKSEYHQLLAKSKIVFSASQQETLGISVGIEGPLLNCIPLSPDRLSYSEIFDEYQDFLYPSNWTTNYASYVQHRSILIEKITQVMDDYNRLLPKLEHFTKYSEETFFSSANLINKLKEHETN